MKTIRSLSIPTSVHFDKARCITAIARRFEALHRSLNPLDVYVATGADFELLLMSMKGYGRLVERMNSLEEGVCILDPRFSELDPLESGRQEINTEFVADLVSQLVVQVSGVVEAVRKFDSRMARKSNRAVADLVAAQEKIVSRISPLLFLKPFLASASSKRIRQGKEYEGTQGWSLPVFDYIRDQSSNRNSYALSNYLGEKFGFFCFVASLEQRNLGSASLMHVGNRLLEREHVVWLADFFGLVSEEAFQRPFGDEGDEAWEDPIPKVQKKKRRIPQKVAPDHENAKSKRDPPREEDLWRILKPW
jgi:hypothetical protein